MRSVLRWELFDFDAFISTKEKGRHQPSFFFGGNERTRGSVQAASKKKTGPFSDQRERRAACPAHPKDGLWVQTPRRALAAISTIAEPVEPYDLAGFSLCSKVGGVNDMPVSDRYSFPKRQTEIRLISLEISSGLLFCEYLWKISILSSNKMILSMSVSIKSCGSAFSASSWPRSAFAWGSGDPPPGESR